MMGEFHIRRRHDYMMTFARSNTRLKKTAVAPCVLRLLVKRSSGKKACVVEIRNDQTFTELDAAIRNSLGYDTWDHCSGFFEGVPWKSQSLVEVYPDGSGPGQELQISALPISTGMELGYVYDFGDDLQHSILVEEIFPIDATKQYPVSTTLLQPSAKKRGKSATW